METIGQESEDRLDPSGRPERDAEREYADEDGAEGEAERDWLGNHPEAAEDQSRISVVTGSPGTGSIRRTANTGDIVEEGGPSASAATPELSFERNSDFMGSEGAVAETEDFGRGSGALSGKLRGEEAVGARSGEPAGPAGGHGEAAAMGFDASAQQDANRRVAEPGSALSEAGRPDRGDRVHQGRDLGDRTQATASQAFGRDIGSSGLPGIYARAEAGSDQEAPSGRPRPARRPSDWSAVLGRLGGSSPGSEENLRLAAEFAAVRFPATREEVLRCLPPDAGFRVRSASVDLREAIQESRLAVFQNTYDLIDAVKDEFRRAEQRETRAA